MAYYGHDGQYRDPKNQSDAPLPYIVHPVGVAIIGGELLPDLYLDDTFDDVISACLIHDLLEDTDIDHNIVKQKTSPRTLELAIALTKPLVRRGSNHHQRNEQFFRQITAAGKTAMFIKICDHCQNISRPNQTPINLLEKAIRKGHKTILRYFDRADFPDSFKQKYLQYLFRAEEEKSKIKQNENIDRKKWSLENVIDHCIQVASRKVLEQHDFVEIIQEISNASFVRITDPQEFAEEAIFTKQVKVKQNLKAQINKQIKNGIIEIDRLPKEVKTNIAIPADYVYILNIPWRASIDRVGTILVGIRNETKSEWVAIGPLQLILSFLSERLIAQERDIDGNLINTLKSLRLNVDVEYVHKLQLGRQHIVQLREFLDYGEFIRKRLFYILEYELIEKTGYGNDIVIESRVKPAQSFLKKMLSRNLIDFSEIDDTVGFRIVCISQQEVKTIGNEVIRCFNILFNRENAEMQKRYFVKKKEEISSKLGYRAFHLYFAIPLKSSSDILLGCEFQIRTVFQDAWARISHSAIYKKASNKKDRKSLKDLAELRDKADTVVDLLLGS